jgi:hypothetical protein
MFGSTVEHWVATLQRWLQLWSFHLRTGSACIVPYESIVKEPWAAIGRIAAYLGLSLEPDCLEKIGQEVSFEAVKRFSQHVNELKPPRLIQSGEYVFDRETLLHKDHIRDGRIGYGARILDPEQVLAINSVLEKEGFAFLCEEHGVTHSTLQGTATAEI